MEKPIASGLKTTFLVHMGVGLVFGLAQLLAPQAFYRLFGMSLTDVDYVRMLGGAVLGFTVTSWLGYQAQHWEQVRIVVVGEIVWTLLAALVALVAVLSGALPAAGWITVIIMAGFCAAFTTFYFQEARLPAQRLGPSPR
jgi:hypothetical protein